MSVTARNIRETGRPFILDSTPSIRKEALPEIVRRDVARVLRDGWTGMPQNETQFLTDWIDGAYGMPGLMRLLRLHVGATTHAAAFAFPDRLTLWIAEKRAAEALSFEEASYLETIAQATVDPLQHDALTTRCLSKKLLLAEALIAQIRTSKDLLGVTLRDVKEGR